MKQPRRTRQFASYEIHSAAFDALPDVVKDYIYRRLHEILSGKDTCPDFSRLSAADRQAILEILLDTKPALANYWRE